MSPYVTPSLGAPWRHPMARHSQHCLPGVPESSHTQLALRWPQSSSCVTLLPVQPTFVHAANRILRSIGRRTCTSWEKSGRCPSPFPLTRNPFLTPFSLQPQPFDAFLPSGQRARSGRHSPTVVVLSLTSYFFDRILPGCPLDGDRGDRPRAAAGASCLLFYPRQSPCPPPLPRPSLVPPVHHGPLPAALRQQPHPPPRPTPLTPVSFPCYSITPASPRQPCTFDACSFKPLSFNACPRPCRPRVRPLVLLSLLDVLSSPT